MKAELYNRKYWIKGSDLSLFKNELESILIACEFEILGFVDHPFSPQGYTSIWLLGESHLALHTYPEHDRSYVELTSCSRSKNELFEASLLKQFDLIQSEKSVF